MTANPEIVFRALPAWPTEVPQTKHGQRKRSPFRTLWSATRDGLRHELRQLKAREVVLSLDVPEADISVKTGLPRADARARSPGVILTFRHPTAGDLRYTCDQYHTWEDNVRGIMLTLASLRAVERYGAMRRGEQYVGSRALPARTGDDVMTPTEAATWLAERYPGMAAFGAESAATSGLAADVLRCAADAERVYRSVAGALHPDRGGAVGEFQRLQAAWAILSAHHDGAAP